MTPELIELSKQAAEVLGIEPMEIYPSHFCFADKTTHGSSTTWLAEDSGRCADIAIERGINTMVYDRDVDCWFDNQVYVKIKHISVEFADHNGDKKAAWREAVLKAVIEQDRMG